MGTSKSDAGVRRTARKSIRTIIREEIERAFVNRMKADGLHMEADRIKKVFANLK